MIEKEPGIIATIMLYLSAVGVWLSGEVGRTVLAGSAGGLFRWLMASRRRLRDGAAGVLAGAVVAKYTWPGVLAMFNTVLPDLGDGKDVQAMAAFLAGLGGMSIAKALLAFIEYRAEKLRGGHDA